MIRHHIAKNKEGVTVDIQDVSEQNRKEGYYCVVCGNEMIPVLGNEREHHFRHKEKGECNGETYLHWYAKYHIKKVFDNSKEFYISYKVPERCCKYDSCECRKDENVYKYKYPYCERNILLEKEDLKLKGYDTCEIEAGYKKFIADVKLYSKKNLELESIFIEITVTHKCNSKKLESGIKIIEIIIPKNEEVSFKTNPEIIETTTGSRDKINIKFHNFERKKNVSEEVFNNHIFFDKNFYDCSEYFVAKRNKFDLERKQEKEYLLDKKENLEQKQTKLTESSVHENITNANYFNDNRFGHNSSFPINDNFYKESNDLIKSPIDEYIADKDYTSNLNLLGRGLLVNEDFYTIKSN